MIFTALVLVLAASTSAPAPTAMPSVPPAMMKMAMPSYGSNNLGISVKAKQPFQIRLQVASGTGYTWMPQGPIPPGLRLLGVFQQPGPRMMPGSPRYDVLVFRGDDVGKVRLTLQYVRPWERSPKPAKLYTFTVTVK